VREWLSRSSFSFFSFLFPRPLSSGHRETAFPTGSCVTSHALCACVMRVKQRSKATRYNQNRKAAGISQFSRLFNHFHSRRRALSQYRIARFALMTKKCIPTNGRRFSPLRPFSISSLLSFARRSDEDSRRSRIKITKIAKFSAKLNYAITRLYAYEIGKHASSSLASLKDAV